MKPLCPTCLNEMSKAASSRNLFNCEPCREIIQFFSVGRTCDASPDFWLPIRRKRDHHHGARAA